MRDHNGGSFLIHGCTSDRNLMDEHYELLSLSALPVTAAPADFNVQSFLMMLALSYWLDWRRTFSIIPS